MEDVIGEDLRRLDWREVGVDLVGERARFRGVELEDALGKWDFRWGMVTEFLLCSGFNYRGIK